jgi:hypothetical protein
VSIARVAEYPSSERRFGPPTLRDWLLFAAQALLVVMIELGNDIIRGNLFPPNAMEALQNARRVVNFEEAHDIFVEPATQIFFRHIHDVLGLPLSWPDVIAVANNVYAFGHIAVTGAVAVWVFMRHRRHFVLLRNVMLLTNILALVGYELYPMSPPRLTTGLIYNGHAFTFQDTMRHILGTGKLNGTPIGYNPLSAMPSLHVAWAIVMGVTLVLLARNPLLRAFGAIYPMLMVFAVVVTANHYVMDAIGATVVVIVASTIALSWERLKARRSHRRKTVAGEPTVIVETRPRAGAMVPEGASSPADEAIGSSG